MQIGTRPNVFFAVSQLAQFTAILYHNIYALRLMFCSILWDYGHVLVL